MPPPRRRLALAALACVGIIAINNIQSTPGSDGGADGRRNYYEQFAERLGVGSPKRNLNAPYAAYKGEIEPSNRRLAVYAEDVDTGELICETEATVGPEDIPEDVTFTNTIIVGYPGADKRTVMRQMEMMTTMSGRDAWDFQYLGITKQPFIKTNYPHHEGIWGWQNHGDQVMLVIRNIRSTIDEYHDILSDIDYAKTWIEATEKIPRLYAGEVVEDAYVRWRDERTMDEIGWYGWLIDYWMEGGVLRDYFDHKLTTKEHWAKLRQPETFTYGELQWDVNICETDPLPTVTYDDGCMSNVTADCRAKVVISADHLMDPTKGAFENHKIGKLLNQTEGIKDHMIDEAAWECLYDMLIGNNAAGDAMDNTEGFNDYRARAGQAERKHVVSTRHLTKMVQQLTRLINKYSAYDPETDIHWENEEVSQFLVQILTEHRVDLQTELDGMNPLQIWAHPPKPNWVVFPKCGEDQRRVWDYNYPDAQSGTVLDMFPGVA